jgi:hypothetical protein
MITMEISYIPEEDFYSDNGNLYCENDSVYCISDGESTFAKEEFRIERFMYRRVMI